MSASREKSNRKASPAASSAKPAEKATPIGKKILTVVAAILSVAIVVGAVLVNTTFFVTHATAITVGNHNITPAEYGIFYRSIYQTYYEQYGENMMSYLTEVLKNSTEDRIKQVYAIYDAAVAAGQTLSEDAQKDIDEEMDSYKELMEAYGATSVNQILANWLGTGVTESIYRNYRQVLGLVSEYAELKNDEFKPTDDELDAYYKEHADEYDTVTYRQFSIAVADKTLEETQKLANEAAESIKADPSTFAMNAELYASEEYKSYYANGNDISLLSDVSLSSVSSETKEWLASADRKSGDITTITSSDQTNVYVLMFESRGNNEQKVLNYRDLFVAVASDADEATQNAALEKIQGYQKEYEEGAKTLESFTELVNKYTEDTSVTDGKHENVGPNEDVYNFIAAAESVGDSYPQLVQLSDGYHLVYFESYGESYARYLARTAKQSEFEQNWITALTENYSVKTNAFGMKFVQTNITVNSTSEA